MKRILPFVIIIAVAIGAFYFLRRSPNKVQPLAPTSNGANQNSNQLPTGDTNVAGAEPAHKLGPDSAPAKLEEFGDFECPPCGLLHPILVEMHKQFGDQLQITFREFPLVPTHQHAVAAASSAEAAALQGKFWEMHDLLYEHQKDWHEAFDVRPIFEDFAKQAGLDVERFKQDVNGDVVAQRIFLDGKRGHALGVKGTPTVFLNNKEVPFDQLPAEKLSVLIKAAIDANK
ncbi:MAG TPA: thioredoxin domain-containing protein [Pyrinomonadaceae bacterium]